MHVLRLPPCFGFPKPFLWHSGRKTYLAHLLQCVFWPALLSVDGISARGRENIERGRQDKESASAGESLHSDSEGR